MCKSHSVAAAAVLVLVVLAVAGCASPAPAEWRPADQVSWAVEQIEAQRVVKRRLLAADPLERNVEARLAADPRVESARFAILIPGFGGHGVSDDAPFHCAAVLVTRDDAMTEDDVRRLIHDACRAAGGAAQLWFSEVVRDGNTWAVPSGLLYPTQVENPDLSALPRP